MDCTARSIASEIKSCSVAVRLVSVERVVPQPASTSRHNTSKALVVRFAMGKWHRRDAVARIKLRI